jgi:hypothetical protein
MVEKPKLGPDGLFISPDLQPEIGKLTQAQQARQDQIALAGRAKLASLSARLEAVRPKPKVEPDEEPAEEAEKGVARHALPAIIPPQSPPATWSDLLTVMNNQHANMRSSNRTKVPLPAPFAPIRTNATSACLSGFWIDHAIQ